MTLNAAGLSLIKKFEGCKLVVYKDLRGLLTVGYGHRTNMPEGQKIDQSEADSLLAGDLVNTCNSIKTFIKPQLNDNQFSALVCLGFNIGTGALRNSTLIKLVNSLDFKSAANEFPKWDKVAGIEIPGLLKRRLAEQQLFNS